MAFRFGDPGGRIYQAINANTLQLWTTVNANQQPWLVSAGSGRNVGSALSILSNANSSISNFTKVFDNQAIWGIAFAIKIPVLPTTGNCPIIFIYDGASLQASLWIGTNGEVIIMRSNSVALGTVPAGTIIPGVWTHIELKLTIHSSTANVYVGVNGVQKLALINQNTRASGNNYASDIRIGIGLSNTVSNIASGTTYFDDIIIYDGQGNDANNFSDIVGPIGDCRLDWLLPNAAGAFAQFTPDSGNNFERIDDSAPDGDGSYVESTTVGHIDTYKLPTLTSSSTIKSIAILTQSRKVDVGPRSMKALIRSNNGNTIHATDNILTNSYAYSFSGFGLNPNNGSPIAWTPAGFNTIEIGQTLFS